MYASYCYSNCVGQTLLNHNVNGPLYLPIPSLGRESVISDRYAFLSQISILFVNKVHGTDVSEVNVNVFNSYMYEGSGRGNNIRRSKLDAKSGLF